MVATDFYKLKEKNDSLLLAPMNFAVLLGRYKEVDIPTTLVDDAGILQALPEGWLSVGEIQKAQGVNLAPEETITGPEGYGSRNRRRDLVQSEGFGIDYVAQEQRLINLETGMGVDTEAPELSAAEVRFAKRRIRARKEYSAILIGLDAEHEIGKEIYPYWIFPRMAQGAKNPIQNVDSNILEYAVRLDMRDLEFDDEHEPFYFGLAGPGAAEFATEMGLTLPAGTPPGE